MTKISLNNIDKSKWISYPFEKIAKRISESVDPNKTDLAVYIGLEHLDAETVHIRRHGAPSDVSGGKLKCYPGDIIFGKRRAYQRKAGIVEQEGICSAHSFVFRANEDVISARLFPFFLHSDQFMHRMVDISVGGLSPTINWSDLKHQEFLLPPKNQQAELADLLWAMDDVIERDLIVLEILKNYSKSYFFDTLNKVKNIVQIQLGNICSPKQWKTIEIKNLTLKGYLVYGGNGVIGRYNEYNHEGPVIAVACRGEYCGNVHLTVPKSYITGNSMCLDDLNTDIIDLKFLYYLLFYSNLNSVITGSAQPQIIKNDISRYKIPQIGMTIQKEIVKTIDEFQNNIEKINSKLQSSKALQKSLINQIF
ncbi:restriction endonuclease subunit S [Elizabethkingia anophelis]|nr:restriction endonuclease subunit S [Elizabethkingia anophelis]MCT4207408.1 restriction endonuclease subunit S [Elizabethkingia anophelis]